jgi:hypothetical protein
LLYAVPQKITARGADQQLVDDATKSGQKYGSSEEYFFGTCFDREVFMPQPRVPGESLRSKRLGMAKLVSLTNPL